MPVEIACGDAKQVGASGDELIACGDCLWRCLWGLPVEMACGDCLWKASATQSCASTTASPHDHRGRLP